VVFEVEFDLRQPLNSFSIFAELLFVVLHFDVGLYFGVTFLEEEKTC